MFTRNFDLNNGNNTFVKSPNRFVVSNFYRVFYKIVQEEFEADGHKAPYGALIDSMAIRLDLVGEAHTITFAYGNSSKSYIVHWTTAINVLTQISLFEGKKQALVKQR